MKKILVISVIIVSITAGYSIAQMGGGMMGGNQQQEYPYQYQQRYPYQGGLGMMGPGMMSPGMMSPGMMGPGMMGPGMMGPGMMGPGMMGPGMMGPGMMGPGMMGPGMMGPGMMGGYQPAYPYQYQQQYPYRGGPGMGYGGGPGYGYDAEKYQKFLNDTTKLRKELYDKRFEYFEAMRNPDTKQETISKLEQELQELQKKIYEKAQGKDY